MVSNSNMQHSTGLFVVINQQLYTHSCIYISRGFCSYHLAC